LHFTLGSNGVGFANYAQHMEMGVCLRRHGGLWAPVMAYLAIHYNNTFALGKWSLGFVLLFISGFF